MKKITKQHLEGYKLYDPKIIAALGAALLVGAAVTMLLYKTALIRCGLLLVLCAAAFWKRKAIMGLVKAMKK